MGMTRWLYGAIALLILLVILFGLILFWNHSRLAAVRGGAAISASQAGAAAASGKAATNIVMNEADAEEDTNARTIRSDQAIRNSAGAKQDIGHDVHDAGLAGLCASATYHSDPKCMQHPGP